MQSIALVAEGTRAGHVQRTDCWMAGLDEFAESLLGESSNAWNLFQCCESVSIFAAFSEEAPAVAENHFFADVQ